jgi:hypothetical protein
MSETEKPRATRKMTDWFGRPMYEGFEIKIDQEQVFGKWNGVLCVAVKMGVGDVNAVSVTVVGGILGEYG